MRTGLEQSPTDQTAGFEFSPTEARKIMQDLEDSRMSGDKATEAFQLIEIIVQDPRLINTFDMKGSDDLDAAILYALIKTSSEVENQLELALSWNRVDIAQDKIISKATSLPQKVGRRSQQPMMSLNGDRCNFRECGWYKSPDEAIEIAANKCTNMQTHTLIYVLGGGVAESVDCTPFESASLERVLGSGQCVGAFDKLLSPEAPKQHTLSPTQRLSPQTLFCTVSVLQCVYVSPDLT
ncbi:unnamed protein product [Protopolystoma xenopodis]|uniref:Uncharacterized protein n=1 Tax=Protopolystoma xenopodis TaxID=117903 RepID=A0A3S5FE58_9PLAT|nr:unnamed protein product [Protopolystoma xenopodis]